MQIEQPAVIDLIDTKNVPALSATSDVPVIETRPDATNEGKPPAVVDDAAPEKAEEPGKSADPEQPDSPSANDEAKPAKGVQKRLDELVKQREDERRRAEAAEAREKQLLEALNKPKEEAKPVEDQEPQKPNKADYNDPDEYDRALDAHIVKKTDWLAAKKANETIAEEKRKQAETANLEQQNKVRESFLSRVDKFKETHPDYAQVAESPDVQVSIPMAHAIAHAEDGPGVAYYLGKHPEESAAIAALTLTQYDAQSQRYVAVPNVAAQLMELGKIAVKLQAPAVPVSAAPKPIKPNTPTDTTEVDPETESMEAYAIRRNKERQAKSRNGMRH